MLKVTREIIDAITGQTIEGYKILKARVKGGCWSDSDCYGIALGRLDSEFGTIFVTWQWHIENEGDAASFYWGHYIENEDVALADYLERQ